MIRRLLIVSTISLMVASFAQGSFFCPSGSVVAAAFYNLGYPASSQTEYNPGCSTNRIYLDYKNAVDLAHQPALSPPYVYSGCESWAASASQPVANLQLLDPTTDYYDYVQASFFTPKTVVGVATQGRRDYP